MKTCPQCGQQWGVKFKFCPQDGTNLPEVVATMAPPPAREPPQVEIQKAKANQRLVNVEPVTATPTAPSRPAVKDKPFAMPQPQRKRRSGQTDEHSVTRTRAFGSVSEAPRTNGEEPWVTEQRATSKADSLMRGAPTVLVDALTGEQVETDREARAERKGKRSGPGKSAADADTTPDNAQVAKADAKKKSRSSDFSETAWFASAPHPDEVDPTTGSVVVEKGRYAAEKVAPEGRKRFSLRRDGEE